MTKEIMKEAHKMTRGIVEKYKDVDYKVQLGLCIAYLLEKEGEEKLKLKKFKSIKGIEFVLMIGEGNELTITIEQKNIFNIPTHFRGDNELYFTLQDGREVKMAINNESFNWFLENRKSQNKQCKICGEYFAPEELKFGICYTCYVTDL